MLARTRLMAARSPWYLLADSPEGQRKEGEITGKMPPSYKTDGDVRKGFVHKRVPHVTLKSIANDPDIREGMTRQEIDAAILRHADTDCCSTSWGNARHFVHGDRGVSEWTFTGTAVDGTRVEVNGCDVFTFRDGKIAVKNSSRKNRRPVTP